MTFSGQSLATIREMELSYHHYISIRYMCELLHKLPNKLKLTIFENQAISRKPLRSLGLTRALHWPPTIKVSTVALEKWKESALKSSVGKPILLDTHNKCFCYTFSQDHSKATLSRPSFYSIPWPPNCKNLIIAIRRENVFG